MQIQSITQLQRLQFAFQLMQGGMQYVSGPTGAYYTSADLKYVLERADSLIKEAGFVVEGSELPDKNWHEMPKPPDLNC